MKGHRAIRNRYLDMLYRGEKKDLAIRLLDELYEKWMPEANDQVKELSQKDCILIAYGDCMYRDGEKPLHTLDEFLRENCEGVITNVHLLPVFPYTSDDGFSVSDYNSINPVMGSWEDVENLGSWVGVMMDGVINHTSKSHEWFRKCCEGEAPYTGYYIECDKDADYSTVTRPRALPLLTEFDTKDGKKWFWTTFSDDQIDVNFESPYLLKEILEVLLLYASKGARFIRLDAIGFAWKKLGTTCMHLKETHTLIKLLRCVIQEFYPGTMIITETNVPHLENISYFGDGDEAQLVYQFPLPPLTLYTMLSGNSGKLTAWAKSLDQTPLPKGTTFFNFLASHDGIGVRPVDGILNEKEKQLLFDCVLEHGGRISYKTNSDGSQSPYELNINYLEAVTDIHEKDEKKRADCFLASQAVMLSLQGIPGIYYHSLLGSGNWIQGVEESGIPRRINREKLEVTKLLGELSKEGSLRKTVFDGYCRMLKIRGEQSAFSPFAGQIILDLGSEIFALERENKESGQKITVLINITAKEACLEKTFYGKDLLQNGRETEITTLKPYQIVWLV